MTHITPTVGRIVWFFETGWLEPRAAIVCAVNADETINLFVLSPNGEPESHLYVHLVQEGDQVAPSRRAEWMPYQLGQAKKHEAAGEQKAAPGV